MIAINIATLVLIVITFSVILWKFVIQPQIDKVNKARRNPIVSKIGTPQALDGFMLMNPTNLPDWEWYQMTPKERQKALEKNDVTGNPYPRVSWDKVPTFKPKPSFFDFFRPTKNNRNQNRRSALELDDWPEGFNDDELSATQIMEGEKQKRATSYANANALLRAEAEQRRVNAEQRRDANAALGPTGWAQLGMFAT